MASNQPYIVDDTKNRVFRLNRETLVSDSIYRLEMERVFSKCWIYVGHGSEVAEPGDFRTRIVAGRPVILCRSEDGQVRCFFNTCRHRAAIVCREREGNALASIAYITVGPTILRAVLLRCLVPMPIRTRLKRTPLV